MRFSRIFASILFALFASACATSETVQLEDGSTAYDVSCHGGRFACNDEAKRVCGGGAFVMLDENEFLGIASKGQHGSIRVQCVDDYMAAHSPPQPTSSPARPRPSDGAACRAAYSEVDALAKAWAAARKSEPKEEMPQADAFAKTCLSLPSEAQFCLVTKYRQAHADCRKALSALDEAARKRLDDALLVPGPPAQSDDAPGGAISL